MSYIEKEYDLHLERQDEREKEERREKAMEAIRIWRLKIAAIVDKNIFSKETKRKYDIYKMCIERAYKWI